ncbi:MAG: hypothetical protein F4X54_07970 [Chloroflexi bacterium]|nr:hypothetical protein [Chloroflexota bacterium]MYB84653.1 hypothetical protein [Chloroflexota bacterium]
MAVAAPLLGFVAIGVAYSIWKALHDDERQKTLGFLHEGERQKPPGFLHEGERQKPPGFLREGERQKPPGFLRDVVSSVVPLLALLGAALVFQGFGELVDWDAVGVFGRTIVDLFGGS